MDKISFRNHFALLVENIISNFIFALGLGIFIGRRINKDYRYILILVIAILIIVTVIFPILKWRKTTITIDKDLVVQETNTIFKKKNTLAISTISNVNLIQNIFEKILGVYKLKIDTDTSSTADETDIVIILKREKAQEVKAILEGKNINEIINEEDLYDIKYSNKDIVLNSILSLPIISIIYLIAAAILTISDFSFKEFLEGKNIFEIIFYVLFTTIPAIYGTLSNLFKFYNFKIGRRKNELHISYGLFTKRNYVIPVDKINAIIVKEYTIGRLFKRKWVEIVNVGTGDDDNEGSFILLCEKRKDFSKKINMLLPEYNLEEKLEKQSKKYIFTLIPYMLLFLIALGVLVYFTTWHLIFISLGVIAICILRYINTGVKIGQDDLIISKGVFVKTTKYIKYKKIQMLEISQGAISKPLKIAKASIYILGSLINTVHSIGYYDEEVFEEISDKL